MDGVMKAAAAASGGDWLSALSTLTGVGFAIWYAYFTVTKTIPSMMADHRADMLSARTDFKNEIAAERAHCAEEMQRVDARWAALAKHISPVRHDATT